MKKLFTLLCLLMIMGAQSMAQKFALVDMEYILKNIPAYERASEQLNQVSKKWQAEVDALTEEAQTLYKNYQSEAVFLSTEQKTKKEEEIVAKEKEAAELKKKYFGSIRRMRSFMILFTQSSWKSPWLRKLNKYSFRLLLSTMRRSGI